MMYSVATDPITTCHTNDQSSDSTDSEPHHLYPDIFTLAYSRGINFDIGQMNLFMSKLMLPQEAPIAVKKETSPVSLKPLQISNTAATRPVKKRKESKRTLFSDLQRSILMHWLSDHQSNPYPTSAEKQELMEQTGLNRDQVNVWFTNNRVRHGMSCSSQRHGKNSRSNYFYH